MSILRCLCHIGLHRWRSESEARRYRHNTYWDKKNNRLDPARSLMKVCVRCGTQRIWSFNRGRWRKYEPGPQRYEDTSGAWATEETTDCAPRAVAAPEPVESQV